MKGKFIVLYGINNLGKTTQAKLLVEHLQKAGHKAEYVKYAHYQLVPSGPLINGYIREGNPYTLSAREMQILQVLNRTQYESTLKTKLEEGIHIVAEDYVGTGLAWGIGAGIDETFMKYLNSHLLKEDIAFHFIGNRFSDGIEGQHKHEQDDELTQKVAQVHAKLAKEYGWIDVKANRDLDIIAEELFTFVQKSIS